MKHAIDLDPHTFRVNPGTAVDLDQWPTAIEPLYETKKHYKKALKRGTKRLKNQQRLLYAHNHYALLLIFQAMDAAGKDGAVRHVMSGVNPQGCQVFSFKHPSPMELDHDFLWRTHCALPERGRIGIFNRSYYEEVLIVRVRPDILAAQKLPEVDPGSDRFWADRYRSITESEAHLHRNGTRIVKFFLHLSKAEQTRRFIARIDNPNKNWKFSAADIEQRTHWDAYQDAYAQCLGNTSTTKAPWYVIPADDKKNARLIISHIVGDTLASLDLEYPPTNDARRAELEQIRVQLEREERELEG
ncbi:MAG: ADP-polyphosphate phosphotransferase [Gammaproteobacteria bacterium]